MVFIQHNFKMLELCRICLFEIDKDDSVSIYLKTYDDKLVIEIIKECSSIEVFDNDDLPKFICRKCMGKLNLFYSFRNLIINSDLHLKEKKIKKEYVQETISSVHKENKSSLSELIVEKSEVEQYTSNETIKENYKELITELGRREEETDIEDFKLKEFHCNEDSLEDRRVSLQDSDSNASRQLLIEKIPVILRNIEKSVKSKRKSLRCDVCHKTFKVTSTYNRHVMIHTGEKPFACEFCDKRFITNYALIVHKRVHTGDKPYSCDICQKKFGSPSGLINHKRAVHNKADWEGKYRCETCNRDFCHAAQLKIHERRHRGEKPYMCDICSKMSSDRGAHQRHMEVHLEQDNAPCLECGKTFKGQKNLQNHIKRHKGLKPYDCEECGQKFTYRSSLKRHKLLHAGLKPFKCRICEKTFSQDSILYRHMRLHSGEKPYPCTLCPKEFAYKHHLEGHVRNHHKNCVDAESLVNDNDVQKLEGTDSDGS